MAGDSDDMVDLDRITYGRNCSQCGRSVPPSRPVTADTVWCSAACQRAADTARHHATLRAYARWVKTGILPEPSPAEGDERGGGRR